MKTTLRSLLLLLTVFALPMHAQKPPRASAAEALHHIRVLADDSLGGRPAGSVYAERAAAYIEQAFRSAGLRPVGDPPSYRQRFTFTAGLRAGPTNAMSVTSGGDARPLTYDVDFRPMTMSVSGSYTGPVVFAGYGLAVPSESYDDYAGLDVSGKAVMLLSGYPDEDNPHSLFAEHASTYVKVQKAKEHGATAVIVVRTSGDAPEDSLFRLTVQRDQPRSTLVVFNLSRARANALLSGMAGDIDALGDSIGARMKPWSFPLTGVSISATADVEEITATTDNVIGYLPPTSGAHDGEYLILGAHYDHLGMGGRGSGSLSPDTMAIHNGADDNASGTGALLSLAHSFAAPGVERQRGMLFISFAAEELGLIGSAQYAKHPLMPLEKAAAMLNMDMVGRMKDHRLIVYGMGTAEGFEELVRQNNPDSLTLTLNQDGFGPSDHSSFYAQKVPVMHFFTDLHSDYHRPSDDADKIFADTLQPVLDIVQRIAYALVNAPERPVYAVAEQRRPQGQMRGFRVWVGTIPDYAEQTDGMRISGVSPKSPAEEAGLEGGDVLIKFGSVEIKNIYDYTYALGQYKPGDVVDVTVRRGDETMTMSVTLVARNR